MDKMTLPPFCLNPRHHTRIRKNAEAAPFSEALLQFAGRSLFLSFRRWEMGHWFFSWFSQLEGLTPHC